jgi:hypothetical protein
VIISRDKFQAATAVQTAFAVYLKPLSLFQQDIPTGCSLGKNKQTDADKKEQWLVQLGTLLLTHVF